MSNMNGWLTAQIIPVSMVNGGSRQLLPKSNVPARGFEGGGRL